MNLFWIILKLQKHRKILKQTETIFNIIEQLNLFNEIIKNISLLDDGSNFKQNNTFFNLHLTNHYQHNFSFKYPKFNFEIDPSSHLQDTHYVNLNINFDNMEVIFESMYDNKTKNFNKTTLKEICTDSIDTNNSENKITTTKKYTVLVHPNELTFNDIKSNDKTRLENDSKIKLTHSVNYCDFMNKQINITNKGLI